MTYNVGSKGQIVIAGEIRKHLGIKPGWKALQRRVGNHLEVYFLPPEHNRSLKGCLSKHLKTRMASPEDWPDVREAAWKKAARDRMTAEDQTE